MADELGGSPGSQGDGEDDPFAIVFDEDFVRAATFREPSARARMLASKWREQPATEAEPPPRRRRWPGRRAFPGRHGQPAPHTGETGRARRPWVTSIVTALVLLLVAAIGAWRISTLVGGVDTPDAGSVADPFAGTPAASFGEGASGIELLPEPLTSASATTQASPGGASRPAASPSAGARGSQSASPQASGQQASGAPSASASASASAGAPSGTGYSPDEMGAALVTADDILVAANIDPKVWAGASPDEFFRTTNGSVASAYNAAVASATPAVETADDPLYYVTRFAPSAAVAFAVRTHGTIRPVVSNGDYLQVHTDVLFVYAVHPPGGPSLPATLVVVRRVVDFRFTFTRTAGGQPIAQPVLADSQYDVSPIVCGPPDGFIHPLMQGAPAAQSSTHIDAHPYDQGSSPEFPGCGVSVSP